jgi:aminoglycoside phosphotransferase (APT) family kinase protein
VHGDFAHYNCLFDPKGERLAAVLDWEAAHLGSRVEDLAWCEWQFRSRFPHEAWATLGLFEGYGETPDWELRERAVHARLAELQRSQAAPFDTDEQNRFRVKEIGEPSGGEEE